jgi:hypothetical protein
VNKRLSRKRWIAAADTSFLTAATVTFSASEEIGIYTSIFAVYSGVSNDTPFSLWILDSFTSSTLVSWQQLCLNRLALAGPISFMTS